MIRVQLTVLTIIALLVPAARLHAQDSKIAVVDFERAVVESVEGKKSSDKFNSMFQTKQTDLEKRQKDLDEAQKKLQNGARTLSDSAKADLQKEIERKTTDLQRLNEDGQKELQALRDELLRPIADRATRLLNAMAQEQGFTLVVDVSNPESNVVWANPKNDVTQDLIKRIDAEGPVEPAKTAAPKPGAATPAPAQNKPPATPPAAPKNP